MTDEADDARVVIISGTAAGVIIGSGRPCLRSVPAHRIVGGGLGRRYDHAARLSEYSFSSSESRDSGYYGVARGMARRGGRGIAVEAEAEAAAAAVASADSARAPIWTANGDRNSHNNNGGRDVLFLRPPSLLPPPPPSPEQVALQEAREVEVEGMGAPRAPHGQAAPGGGAIGVHGAGGQNRPPRQGPHVEHDQGETMVLANLCLEAMVSAWETHGVTTYVPQAYHMPHELCARLLRLLVASKKLTAFTLSGFLSPAALELDLSGCSYVPKSVFKQLGFSCPRLIHLNLSMCSQVNNAVVRSVLQGCSALRQLYLDGCRYVTDAGFHLQQSPFYVLLGAVSLETISVQGCPQVTGELVLHLRKVCRNLKELDLARCKSVGSASVRRVFDSCPSLQSLNVSFLEGVVDEAFEGLPAVQIQQSPILYVTPGEPQNMPQASPGLVPEERSINNVPQPPQPSLPSSSSGPPQPPSSAEGATTPIITPASSLPDLRHLNLGCCEGVTDLALSRVAGAFPDLEGVHLEHCLKVSDVGVRALAVGCGGGLRALGLRNCGQITDDALEALSLSCPLMEWLDFSWCGQVTDRGVKRLAAGCPALEEVQAVWCDALTDAALSALYKSCTRLEALHIGGCCQITLTAVAKLRDAGVEVFR